MSHEDVTFLKAFNAKEMPDREVARTFVTAENFRRLAGNWNALLLGPRGSGKTTLLKMLRLPALRMWDSEDADQFRQAINFTGVFVPADITWGEMLDALGRRKLSGELKESVVECVFCTNVLLGLVEAFESRITPTENAIAGNYRCAEFNHILLSEAIKQIAGHWQLSLDLLSFGALRYALQRRLLNIQSEVTRAVKQADCTAEYIETRLPFLYLTMVSAVESAISIFNEAIEDRDGKWALLFDEFEIAPAEIQKNVFRRFRSAGNNVLYKIGLAPCTEHTIHSLAAMGTAASEGNDYIQIELWYPEKKAALEFSEKLFQSIKNLPPREALGENHFIDDDAEDGAVVAAYGRGEKWRAVFESLKEKDDVFREYLIHKGIDTDNLETSPGTTTGNTVRKIAPLVAFREAFRKKGSGQPPRGRKKLNFAYSGWEAVSAICEGNPRWLIGILNMMFAYQTHGAATIKPSAQVDIINKATESFSSMLTTVAKHQSKNLRTNEPIDKLLRKIGEYFFARLVIDDFVEEPPLSFIVDAHISDDIHNSLRIAINHGALIHIPVKGDGGADFQTLNGKRFRLAYLLAPRFKLPLRATKEVALSSILADTNDLGRVNRIKPLQLGLYDDIRY